MCFDQTQRQRKFLNTSDESIPSAQLILETLFFRERENYDLVFCCRYLEIDIPDKQKEPYYPLNVSHELTMAPLCMFDRAEGLFVVHMQTTGDNVILQLLK